MSVKPQNEWKKSSIQAKLPNYKGCWACDLSFKDIPFFLSLQFNKVVAGSIVEARSSDIFQSSNKNIATNSKLLFPGKFLFSGGHLNHSEGVSVESAAVLELLGISLERRKSTKIKRNKKYCPHTWGKNGVWRKFSWGGPDFGLNRQF